MKILGIDPGSKRLGWCIAENDTVTASGVYHVEESGKSKSHGDTLSRIDLLITTMVNHHEIGMIAYEMPHLRGSGSFILVKIIGILDMIAYRHNSRIGQIHTRTLKKWATGSGKAEKHEMVAAARNWVPGVHDDNEADAILVAMAAMDDMKKRTTPIPTGREVETEVDGE